MNKPPGNGHHMNKPSGKGHHMNKPPGKGHHIKKPIHKPHGMNVSYPSARTPQHKSIKIVRVATCASHCSDGFDYQARFLTEKFWGAGSLPFFLLGCLW